MKKRFFIIPFVVILTGFVCFVVLNDKGLEGEDVDTIESFGNQINIAEWEWCFTSKDGEWIYGENYNEGTIIKLNLNDPDNPKTVYMGEGEFPVQVSASGGWLYFVEDAGEEDSPLCRVRESGGHKKVLLEDFDSDRYVLTDTKIYYQKGYWESNDNIIYAINLHGGHQREVISGDVLFNGIDNGWVYYVMGKDDDIYRIRPDGTNSEKVLDGINIGTYVVDKEQIFFTRYHREADDGKYTTYLIKKEIKGEETILIDESNQYGCLNKEGDWLYFAVGSVIYRINTEEKGEKQYVYNVGPGDEVTGILLYDGDLLIESWSRLIYLKQDGTTIDLTAYDWGRN